MCRWLPAISSSSLSGFFNVIVRDLVVASAMPQDSEGIARTSKGLTTGSAFTAICPACWGATRCNGGPRASLHSEGNLFDAAWQTHSVAWRSAIAVVMLIALSWSNPVNAQLVFDPSNGFLTQTLNQPTPLLGTTETFAPFSTSALGFVGAPASYIGAGFGGAAAGLLNPPAAVAPTRLTTENPLLPPIAPGAVPVQAADPLAPEVITTPGASILTGFDDNPRGTPSRLADSVSILSPSLTVSADTPHLQGVCQSSFEYLKYARATDQDMATASGSAYELATISPDHLYIDGRASIFQVSPVGNGGFANPQLNGFVTPETILTTSITPVWREKFSDLIETDLRYNYGTVSPIGALSSSSTSAVAATETNQGALTVALGSGSGTLSSRVVLSAADIASQSEAASTQTRGLAELQYRFNPEVAVVARGGYEDLRFQNAGLAFAGPIATLGTRLDLTPTSAINFRYGREDGSWGFNGAVKQSLTPRTVLLLSYEHSLGSQQEQMLSNLNASQLDPYGNIVDAETSVPLALANPELAYNQTGVFRIQQATAAVEHEFETDSLRLYGFYANESALSAGTTSDIARGAQLAWFRTMTPYMRGGLSLGFASETGNQLLSLGLTLTINLRTNIDGVLTYQFTDSMSGDRTTTVSPSYNRNFLIGGIHVSF
jgi:uncharacterized protein (PEP-CTERM system associated)